MKSLQLQKRLAARIFKCSKKKIWFDSDSLEEIKSAAPAEAFIDQVTGKQLEYENHGQDFSLYGETTNIWPK